MTSSSRPGIAPLIASVLGPVLLLLAAFLLVNGGDDDELSEDALLVEQQLAQEQPRVLLLGASTVAQGVDASVFGAALSDQPVAVSKLCKGGSRPANWYVLLKNRVYSAGLKPELVIIGATPRWFFHTGVETQAAKEVMADHLQGYDPVVSQKAYGKERTTPLQHNMEQTRVHARSGFQDWVREVSVGLLFGEGDGSLREQGAGVAEPALERVFGTEDAVDLTLHSRVIPIVEHEVADRKAGTEAGGIQDTFIPDLVQLAHDNGSKVIFVSLPYPESSRARESVDPATYTELVRTLNELGAGWLDLQDLDYDKLLFMDDTHLNAKGRARFSKELAQKLRELDILGGQAMPKAVEPFYVEFTARREGNPAPLTEPSLAPWPKDPTRLVGHMPIYQAFSNNGTRNAGLGSASPLMVLEDGKPMVREPAYSPDSPLGTFVHTSGYLHVAPSTPELLASPAGHYTLALTDELSVENTWGPVYWIYPGTKLHFDFPAWQDTPIGATLQLVISPVGPGQAQPQANIAGQPVTFTPSGSLFLAEHQLPMPTTDWSVEIEAPAGGPMLTLRWLQIATERGSMDIVGDEKVLLPPSVTLFLNARKGDLSSEGPRMEVPLEALEPHARFPLARTPAPELDMLSHKAVGALTPCADCSPLRVIEAGQPFGPATRNCFLLRQKQAFEGAWCQEESTVLFGSSDGSQPGQNGRSYSVGLSDERWILGGLWVYPGDTSQMSLIGYQMVQLTEGASLLRIEGIHIGGDPTATLDITIEADGQSILQRSVTTEELDAGVVEIALDSPMPAGTRNTVLRVKAAPEAPYFYITKADLQQ